MKKKYKTMKIVLLLVIMLCLFNSCGGITNNSYDIFSENVSENDFSAGKDSVLGEKIKFYFNDYFLNNENYIYKEASLFGYSSEGACVNGFYDNDVLKSVIISMYGELGSIAYCYYIIDSETLLLVETIREYSSHIAGEEWSIKKEYTKLYIVINGETYIFDILSMKTDEKVEGISKELFDSAISALEIDSN